MAALNELRGRSVYLDANVFIYALEDLPPWSSRAQTLLGMVETGECTAATSELTLAECLVRPLQLRLEQAVQTYAQSLQTRAHLTLVPVRREILVEASRVRAERGLKLPDAIHVATALWHRSDTFVTNDIRLGGIQGINVALLSEFAAE
jgi:predicted nucleic acid-binding protein